MPKVSIELQKRGFCAQIPDTKKRVNWDALTDALLDIPNVCEVDGPLINGCMGVTYDSDDRPDADLTTELQGVFDRFIR